LSFRAAAVAVELGLAELATDPDQLTTRVTSEPDRAAGPDAVQAADQAGLSLVEINGIPSLSLDLVSKRSAGGFSRARQPVDNFWSQVPDQGKQRMTALRAGSEEGMVPDLLIMVPGSRYQMLACADELRRRRPAVFGRCSRRLVRALCRPYWRAGWCNRDILHALDHRPSMFTQVARELGMPDELVSPRQLILSRLRAWHDDRGRIRPGYWTSRTRSVAGSVAGSATAGVSARELVRQRHGRAGARLLRAGDRGLSVERIVEHGAAMRPGSPPLAGRAGLDPAPTNWDDEGRAVEGRAGADRAARAARDRFRAELVAKARAALSTQTAPENPAADSGQSQTVETSDAQPQVLAPSSSTSVPLSVTVGGEDLLGEQHAGVAAVAFDLALVGIELDAGHDAGVEQGPRWRDVVESTTIVG
jgi:hypothetical protein